MKRRSPSFLQGIMCSACGKPALRTGPSQRYCQECSATADLARKDAWLSKNGKRKSNEAKSRVTMRGQEISNGEKYSLINWYREVNLVWQIRISFPFSWAASKNHIFALRKIGHVALRSESRNFRSQLTLMIKNSLRDHPIVQNKVWIDILVQKPNHRGDAANFVDLICDAAKDGIGIDDRWFSIRRLDWQIVKVDPQIFVGIGQESVPHAQACSSCGRILALSDFHKQKGMLNGVSRNCRECSSARKQREERSARASV